MHSFQAYFLEYTRCTLNQSDTSFQTGPRECGQLLPRVTWGFGSGRALMTFPSFPFFTRRIRQGWRETLRIACGYKARWLPTTVTSPCRGVHASVPTACAFLPNPGPAVALPIPAPRCGILPAHTVVPAAANATNRGCRWRLEESVRRLELQHVCCRSGARRWRRLCHWNERRDGVPRPAPNRAERLGGQEGPREWWGVGRSKYWWTSSSTDLR